MKLGTPNSPAAVKVMLLGSGELGKEIAIELQRLGVETIAVDRYGGAPAQQVAHRSYVIDMTDAKALRALVEQERPHLIVPEIEALATDELVRIENDGLCTVIPTARAAHITMNRERIRVLAAEDLNLPTSPYAFASSLEQLQSAAVRIGFPCFVKPVMSSSGKGQSRLTSAENMAAAWEKALSAGRVREARVIVEGQINFDFEITQLTVRASDGTHFCEPIGHLQKDGDYVESWQPQMMSSAALQKVRDMAAKVTGALGGRGVFGVELFVKGDDVWFSEVSPRPHDTGLVTLITQYQSEFALHARAILGLPVSTTLAFIGASAVIYGGVEAGALVFDGAAEALAVPQSDLRLFGKPQSFVKRRMGVALARGNTIDDARSRARQTAAAIKPRPV